MQPSTRCCCQTATSRPLARLMGAATLRCGGNLDLPVFTATTVTGRTTGFGGRSVVKSCEEDPAQLPGNCYSSPPAPAPTSGLGGPVAKALLPVRAGGGQSGGQGARLHHRQRQTRQAACVYGGQGPEQGARALCTTSGVCDVVELARRLVWVPQELARAPTCTAGVEPWLALATAHVYMSV
jgi:hypothetical protein